MHKQTVPTFCLESSFLKNIIPILKIIRAVRKSFLTPRLKFSTPLTHLLIDTNHSLLKFIAIFRPVDIYFTSSKHLHKHILPVYIRHTKNAHRLEKISCQLICPKHFPSSDWRTLDITYFFKLEISFKNRNGCMDFKVKFYPIPAHFWPVGMSAEKTRVNLAVSKLLSFKKLHLYFL